MTCYCNQCVDQKLGVRQDPMYMVRTRDSEDSVVAYEAKVNHGELSLFRGGQVVARYADGEWTSYVRMDSLTHSTRAK